MLIVLILGNGLVIEDETVVIKPKNGFGGIGGDYVKPTALANVHAFTSASTLPSKLSEPAVSKQVAMLSNIFSVAPAWFKSGQLFIKKVLKFSNVLLKRLKAIMAEKGYETLEDFRGKLNAMA